MPLAYKCPTKSASLTVVRFARIQWQYPGLYCSTMNTHLAICQYQGPTAILAGGVVLQEAWVRAARSARGIGQPPPADGYYLQGICYELPRRPRGPRVVCVLPLPVLGLYDAGSLLERSTEP